jgi:hypothetical protein
MQVETTTIRRALGAIALAGALALAAGCHSNNVSASGPDPAQANLAPVNGQTQVLAENTSYSPQQQGESYPQQAPAPVEQAYPQQAGGYYPSDTEQAGEEALEETTQAPPPLPEYDQPPAPGSGYIWTPGYWAWGPSGYYWVPGAWVEAPYYGALWTPPYWGWNNGRYRFHHGYWGRHVGYYGGIDYGFGYIGLGYFGGYWSGNNFYYNRAVTHVGGGIRTVYERPVVYNNVRYGVQPVNRVSYNGGRGGLNVQPRPAEVAAMHEHHDAPMAVQHQVRVEASQNRAQTYSENHGRPSQAYVQHGFANTRGIAPAPHAEEAGRPSPEVRPGQPNTPYANEHGANAMHGQPYGNEPRVENRAMQPQPNANPRFDNRSQPQPQPNGNARFENHAQPQPQPNGNARFENHAQPQPQPRVEAPHGENRAMQPQPNAAQPRFENHAQPQPQPRVENRAMGQPQPRAEAPRVENRPQPQPQPRMENRPQPQPQQHMEVPRPESRPAQQPHPQAPPPQAHPAEQARPAPQPHGGGNNGHQGDGDHGHR